MKSISLLEHLVDMVWHSVLTLLHEFQLTDIRLKQTGKVGIGTFRALDVEPLLSVLQLAHQPVVMREAFIIAPHQQHGADDGARLTAHDGQACL